MGGPKSAPGNGVGALTSSMIVNIASKHSCIPNHEEESGVCS